MRLWACLEASRRRFGRLRASSRPCVSSPLDGAKVPVFAQIVAASVGPFSDVAVNRAVVLPSGTTSRTEGGKAQKAHNEDHCEDSEDAVGGFVLRRLRLACHSVLRGSFYTEKCCISQAKYNYGALNTLGGSKAPECNTTVTLLPARTPD